MPDARLLIHNHARMNAPVPIQRGHFVLESGLHTDVWLELEALFLDPLALEPHLDALARQLRPYEITAVCGPLVGGALVAQSIAATVLEHVPTFDPATIELRASSQGTYLSVTVVVRVESREQLERLYRALATHPLVSIVL